MHSTLRTNVGSRIRQIRTDAELRQKDIARACGVDRVHITRIEMGACNPSLVLLVQIADALGVPLVELTDGLRLVSLDTRVSTQ